MMGGAQYQVKLIIDRLLSDGNYEVHYITQRASDIEDYPYKIHLLNGKMGKKFGQVSNFMSLIRMLMKINPDVIYQRVAGGYTGICAWYANKYGKKMIFHVAQELDVNLEEEKEHRKINPIDLRLKNYGINNATNIIAQTENQNSLLKQFFNKSADEVIYNFQPFERESSNSKENEINICWIANVKPNKRPQVLIDIAKGVKNRSDIKFTMMGKMMLNSADEENFYSQIKEVGNIFYAGELSIDDVNKYICESDLLISTSVSEGFSNTFIQAWLRGVPVFSMNSNPDYLFDKYSFLGQFFDGKIDELLKDLEIFKKSSTEQTKAITEFSESTFSLRNIDKLINYF
jgi:glycosyltransferase involved in cell wall biosynthesis